MPNVNTIILANPAEKVAVIIEHVENYKKFGLPDAPRNWSLNPNAKNPPPPKVCPRYGKRSFPRRMCRYIASLAGYKQG